MRSSLSQRLGAARRRRLRAQPPARPGRGHRRRRRRAGAPPARCVACKADTPRRCRRNTAARRRASVSSARQHPHPSPADPARRRWGSRYDRCAGPPAAPRRRGSAPAAAPTRRQAAAFMPIRTAHAYSRAGRGVPPMPVDSHRRRQYAESGLPARGRARCSACMPWGAADGTEALLLAASGAFDLLLLVLSMPGLGGLEVLQRLQATPRPPHTGPRPSPPAPRSTRSAARADAGRFLRLHGQAPALVDLRGLLQRHLGQAASVMAPEPALAQGALDDAAGLQACGDATVLRALRLFARSSRPTAGGTRAAAGAGAQQRCAIACTGCAPRAGSAAPRTSTPPVPPHSAASKATHRHGRQPCGTCSASRQPPARAARSTRLRAHSGNDSRSVSATADAPAAGPSRRPSAATSNDQVRRLPPPSCWPMRWRMRATQRRRVGWHRLAILVQGPAVRCRAGVALRTRRASAAHAVRRVDVLGRRIQRQVAVALALGCPAHSRSRPAGRARSGAQAPGGACAHRQARPRVSVWAENRRGWGVPAAAGATPVHRVHGAQQTLAIGRRAPRRRRPRPA